MLPIGGPDPITVLARAGMPIPRPIIPIALPIFVCVGVGAVYVVVLEPPRRS